MKEIQREYDQAFIDECRQSYEYNPETGEFFSLRGKEKKKMTGSMHASGTYSRMKIGILSVSMAATHAAWILHYGEAPHAALRLKDGDPSNLRISNIEVRPDLIRQRHSNRGKPVKGVSMSAGKYRASIHLGTFDTVEEAEKAYQDALRKLGRR